MCDLTKPYRCLTWFPFVCYPRTEKTSETSSLGSSKRPIETKLMNCDRLEGELYDINDHSFYAIS